MTPLPIPAPRASGTTHSLPVPLYWARYGPSGASPILMLHGGPGASHDYLLPQMLALANQHELLFYDQRGGGRSRTDDPQPITWRTHVEDLGGIAREFSLQPLSILGYSWGGLLAMLYAIEAARDSSRTPPARLVLVEPAPVTREYRQQFEAEFNRRQRSAPISTMREELQQSGLQSRDREAYRQRAFELSVAGYFADPAKARDLTPFRIIERVQRSVWDSLGDFDVTAELEAVRCPALVIHGRDDPIPVASSQRAARALGAQLLLLADCGHVPYVERPTKMFDAVSRFLAETEPLG